MNAHPAPAEATRAPPSAGPIARPALNVRLERATAWPNSRCGTRSGWIACHAGPISAVPTPRANVRASRLLGVTWSVIVSTASRTAHTSIHAWVPMSSRRRSKMSASAPAGRPSSRNGSRLAVWMRATSVVDVVRSPISQAAATVWKNVPMLEPSWAAKRAANTVWRSGAHGDSRSGGAALASLVSLVHRSTSCGVVAPLAPCRAREDPPPPPAHGRRHRRAIVTDRRCGSRVVVPIEWGCA